MNYVLDIGNVLISFNPRSFLRDLINDRETESKMLNLVFLSPEWEMADKGTITRKDACEAFCEREPGLESIIRRVMDNLTDMLEPMPDTVELLPEIKAAGHKLYYLSNYSVDGRKYIMAQYPFFRYFDGGLFSCDVHVTKPSPEIYSLFLRKYQLSAGECLFFDDVEENIKAASNVGMNGILFTNAQDIKRFIDADVLL